MGVIITYDVPHSHTELKKRMIAKGYSKTVTGQYTYNLPNTTLYKQIDEPSDAIKDLKDSASGLVEIERAIAVKTDKYYAIVGQEL